MATTTTRRRHEHPPPPEQHRRGVDGSTSSHRALAWAARQATLENRPLTLVHAAHLAAVGEAISAGAAGEDARHVLDELAVTGRGLLTTTTEQLRRAHPEVEVHEVYSRQDPRELLLACTAEAAMTVLGSRGRGPVKSLLLGSVSLAVSRYAHGPVVIVRGSDPDTAHGGVVVDVDGSADSLPAIEFAYRAAATRDLPLTALHTYWDAARRDSEEHTATDDQPGLDDVRALLSQSVAGMREKYPEVRDRLTLQHGFRDQQLVRASSTAALIVVGTRPRSRLDLLHASVAATVVELAHCDVAVVPAVEPH